MCSSVPYPYETKVHNLRAGIAPHTVFSCVARSGTHDAHSDTAFSREKQMYPIHTNQQFITHHETCVQISPIHSALVRARAVAA